MLAVGVQLVLSKVHPEWLAPVGMHLGGRAVHEQMLANPRIERRLMAALRKHYDVSPSDNAALPPDDRAAAERVFADPSEFSIKTGLIVEADYLAQIVGRSEVEALSRTFGLENLRGAVRLREFNAGNTNRNFDGAHFADMVEKSGGLCILAWARTLPKSVNTMVQFHFSPRADDELAEFSRRVPFYSEIVRAAATKM